MGQEAEMDRPLQGLRRAAECLAGDPPRQVSVLERLKDQRSTILGHLGELDALIARAEKDPTLLDALRTFRRFV